MTVRTPLQLENTLPYAVRVGLMREANGEATYAADIRAGCSMHLGLFPLVPAAALRLCIAGEWSVPIAEFATGASRSWYVT